MKQIILLISALAIQTIVLAQANPSSDSIGDQRWNLHAQMTVVTQHNLPFKAAYSGNNSFDNHANTVKPSFSDDVR